MPSRANEGKENKDDQEEQEAVEEGEKAGSDKAAVAWVRTDNRPPSIGIKCHEMSAPSRGCGTQATYFTKDRGL